MRRTFVGAAALLGLCVVIGQTVLSQPETGRRAPLTEQVGQTPGGARTDRTADEQAIRSNVDAFVKAYNAGDAKGIAALFIPDGQIIDQDGEVTEGREAIAKAFGDIFAETPKKKIEVTVDSIRFIGSDLAVETGTTKETDGSAEPPVYDRYTVLHVRRDGKWQMALARDEEGPAPTPHERLKPLAWLVGDWIDDGGSAVVRSSCKWSDDGNFLLQEFDLRVSGREAMKVTQRVGWDPLGKQIHSWMFDSLGGYGESAWTRDGDGWIIKATGVRPDGSTGSATNLLQPMGNDGYIWKSTDRIVGGERQPETQVKVVRKPPEPKQ